MNKVACVKYKLLYSVFSFRFGLAGLLTTDWVWVIITGNGLAEHLDKDKSDLYKAKLKGN